MPTTRKLGSAHPRNAPYEAFHAADGWFVIAAGNNKLWLSVCEVVGISELTADPRFATPGLRAQHQVELKALLQPRFLQESVAHWLARFSDVGVPHAPINGYAEALDDPQSLHLELVQSITLPGGNVTRTVACPVRLDGAPVPLRDSLPQLGEHTEFVRGTMREAV